MVREAASVGVVLDALVDADAGTGTGANIGAGSSRLAEFFAASLAGAARLPKLARTAHCNASAAHGRMASGESIASSGAQK